MNKKTVLILTYYWPPSGGAGVQRWLKFVKYLPKHNWNPVIFTVKNGEYPVLDEGLNNDVPKGIEVIKSPIWEPYGFYKKLTGRKKNDKINSGFLSEKKKSVFFEKLSVWIRGNFFIPDARKFWIKPSIKLLKTYIQENNVDVIISSGPPHSTHLIAKDLASIFKIPWIADFRDPWTNIDFYNDLLLTKWADSKHKKLEKSVLENANVTLTIGETLASELRQLGAKKVEVIENGYDLNDIKQDAISLDDKFTIAHIGSFTPSRNIASFWMAISELIKEDESFSNSFELKLIGKVDFSVFESLEKYELNSYVNHIPYLAHDLVIKEQMKSHVLLLMINQTPNAKGIVTGKVFEYMASGRPTLIIGPTDGDVSKIVLKCNAGITCDYNDVVKIKQEILQLFNKKKEYKASINSYSRESLTEKLVDILNSLV